MPDPYDAPDPGPIDDLLRETERIAHALGRRAEARRQRHRGDQAARSGDQAARSGDRGTRRSDRADNGARLAERLEARGIDHRLAQTRVRAGRSFGAPATAIGGRAADAGQIAVPSRARTLRGRQAQPTERPRGR